MEVLLFPNFDSKVDPLCISLASIVSPSPSRSVLKCELLSADLEAEEPEVTFTARQKIATLGSCFSQLTHKALTIFQNSAKMEVSLKLTQI